jgi:hypothetical protein
MAYSEWETLTYASLEGDDLLRLEGNNRRMFTVRAKRNLGLPETYDLSRVLDRLKPADARYEISRRDIDLHAPLTIQGTWSDSVYWEVISKVTAITPATNLPYPIVSGDPEEQPRPPFSGYQGEAWSYVLDLAGVAAYYTESDLGDLIITPPQRVVYQNGSRQDFSPESAMLPARLVEAGRSVSDAIMLAYPYVGATGTYDRYITEARPQDPLGATYVDGIPLDVLNQAIQTLDRTDPFQQNPEHRYWVSLDRMMNHPAEEILEVRLQRISLVNYVTFEIPRYPHRAIFEVFDSEGGVWNEVFREEIKVSSPRVFSPGLEVTLKAGHPQHAFVNHWLRVSRRIPPLPTKRVRIRMQRVQGIPPREITHDAVLSQVTPTREVPYSLAVRSLDLGYRVSDRDDFEFFEEAILGQTKDAFGSQVQFEVREQAPALALDELTSTAWRSEPQPVSYAVVNFYLDTRDEDEIEGQVIDRFYLDPTHSGPHFSIYYSNDSGTPTDQEFFEGLTWTPIPRSYVLQKGYVHVPPTKAKFWKFEFTGLTAEFYESFIPIVRRTKLFPQSVVQELILGFGHADEALLPGMGSAIETAEVTRYKDALELLRSSTTALAPGDYRPTEALYTFDLEAAARLRNESWVFGFMPWHQSMGQYPKFTKTGKHQYDEIEVRHNTKVAFFVGLRTIKAYRANWEADDDTEIYFDPYNDIGNLSIPFSWSFNPGYLFSDQDGVEATSRVFRSLHPVKALQFATVQSDPVQLVPDHNFRNTGFWTDYTWDNPDFHLKIGDVSLIYSPTDYSVTVIRREVPAPTPVGSLTGGIVDVIHHPVFSYRLGEIDDIINATEGGFKSPLLALSSEGRAYAAVRFTMNTDQTSPLVLQVVNAFDENEVFAEKSFTARRGETVEGFVGFNIPDAIVRARFVQLGKSSDIWKVYSLAVFDPSILWEFSVNGGTDWYPAYDIRNNDHGILSFPEVGNQLRYRVRAFRQNLWVSAIKIRPHYIGIGNARSNSTHRGPNVSIFDHDVPIQSDPMFTSWRKPVPYWWFAANKRFPLLAVEGATDTTIYANLFVRQAGDTVDEPVDDAEAMVTVGRYGEDTLSTPVDTVSRGLILSREVSEEVDEPVDEAEAFIISGESDPIIGAIPDDI